MTSPFCTWEESEDSWKCSQCNATVPKATVPTRPIAGCRTGMERLGVNFRIPALAEARKTEAPGGGGPGTELKRILSKFGIKATPTCKCNSRAIQMDRWGADVCEERIEEIVNWLREEAASRNLPFVNKLAKILVRQAISNARKHLPEQSDNAA